MSRTFRKQTLSMRGTPVDFAALAAQNAQQPVLGNSKTNVRGDLLGDNAVVLKTQEQIEAEWARKRALQQTVNRAADIKNRDAMPKTVPVPGSSPRFNSLPEDMEFPTIQDLVNNGTANPSATKRKIVDSD